MYEKNILSTNQAYTASHQMVFGNYGILYSSDIYDYPVSSSRENGRVESSNPQGIYDILGNLVSGGDLAVPVSSGDLVQAGLVENQIEFSADYARHFQAVETKLDIIIVLMLVFWAISKIKNAVRSFTGRNIDN